jgi:glycosyltransferase involved in cell wall biosynthesis
MKIAQVAPLYESVPPAGYGGTERVVSWLTEELVRMGHEVTLFANGQTDSGLPNFSPDYARLPGFFSAPHRNAG